MPHMNAGEAIVECLRNEKVQHVFGIIGSACMEVLDALYDPTDIEFISTRHEQAAAHMADAYARARNGLGVCLAQNGPGAANMVMGISLAKSAYSPVLALAGAPMTAHEQRDSFQEIDQISLFRPITKAVVRLNRGDRAVELTQHAIRIAMSGQRGPVLLDFPRDLLSTEMDFTVPKPEEYRPVDSTGPAPAAVKKAIALLNKAKRPLIVAGGGVKWSEATQQVLDLADTMGIPVVTSSGHRDVIPNDHRLFFGQLGPRGSTLAKDLAQEADVIFALGCRLGFTTAFYNYNFINKDAKLIQSDIEPLEIGRIYPVDVAIVGDAAKVAEACADEINKVKAQKVLNNWLSKADALREEWMAERTKPVEKKTGLIQTQDFFAELRRAVPKDLHVTTEAGYWCNVATDAFDFFEPNRFFGPLDQGALGFSFPAALGVKFARPDAPVLCISGDGGFAMNMQEIETAVRCKLNLVVLVLNNGCWGVEKSYQREFFNGRYVGADFGNPRFDQLAEAFGARGVRVEKPGEIGDVVAESLKSDLPTIVDVMVDPDEMHGLRRDAVKARTK